MENQEIKATEPISAMEQKFKLVVAEAQSIAKQVNAITITDEITLAMSEQALSKANRLLKDADEKRKQIKKPYADIIAAIDGTVKNNITIPLQNAIDGAKAKLKIWNDEQRSKEPIPMAVVDGIAPIAEIPASAVSATRKVWKFEIINESKLPREFLMPNEKAIREFMYANREGFGTGVTGESIRFYLDETPVIK